MFCFLTKPCASSYRQPLHCTEETRQWRCASKWLDRLKCCVLICVSWRKRRKPRPVFSCITAGTPGPSWRTSGNVYCFIGKLSPVFLLSVSRRGLTLDTALCFTTSMLVLESERSPCVISWHKNEVTWNDENFNVLLCKENKGASFWVAPNWV